MDAADEVLTDANKVANHQTFRHIHRVEELLHHVVKQLLDRADRHDLSKLLPPEVDGFSAANLPPLKDMTYGSEEYDRNKETVLKRALDHHYANNRHHPQHFAAGVEDMNLLDILEMFLDWKAASERHENGNIRLSVTLNAAKYKISPQLRQILENSIEILPP